MSRKELLIDVCPVRLTISESGDGGKLKLRGEFANGNKKTANGRLYKTSLWETVIRKNEKKITERKVTGELDHPDDGKMKLQRVSHLITDLKLENGMVVGELEVLNTQRGRDLRALIEGGVTVGVSSRGLGSVSEDKDGTMVVGDDFEFQTFDVVADPAITTAFPESVTEDFVMPDGAQAETAPVKSTGAEQNPNPTSTVSSASTDVDPAGGETALTRAQSMRKYLKNAEEMTVVKEDNSKLQAICKDLGMRLFCEQALRGHPQIEDLMKTFNGAAHETIDSVKAWVKPLAEQRDTILESKKVIRQAAASSLESKLLALAEQNEALGKELTETKQAVEKSTALLAEANEAIQSTKASRDRMAARYEKASLAEDTLRKENAKLVEESKRSLTESTKTAAAVEAGAYLEARFGVGSESLLVAKNMLKEWADTSRDGLNRLAKIVEENLVKDRPGFNVRSNMSRLPNGAVESALKGTLFQHPRNLTEDKNLGEPELDLDMGEFKRLAGIH